MYTNEQIQWALNYIKAPMQLILLQLFILLDCHPAQESYIRMYEYE